MAQITIEVPDELSQRLAPFKGQLSELFAQFISTRLLGEENIERATDERLLPETHREVLDFLMSQPSPQSIVDFKMSERSQTRLRMLLQKNREVSLSLKEEEELDIHEQLDNLIGLLKVRAFSELNSEQKAKAIES